MSGTMKECENHLGITKSWSYNLPKILHRVERSGYSSLLTVLYEYYCEMVSCSLSLPTCFEGTLESWQHLELMEGSFNAA